MCAQDEDPRKQENARKNPPIIITLTITSENEIKYPENRDRVMEKLLSNMINNPQVIMVLEEHFKGDNIDLKYTFNN